MSHFEKVGVIFITGLVAVILALSLFGSGKQDHENLAVVEGRTVIGAKTDPMPSPATSRRSANRTRASRDVDDGRMAADLWDAVNPSKRSSNAPGGLDVAGRKPPGGAASKPIPETGVVLPTAIGDVEHRVAARESYYMLAQKYYRDGSKWPLIRDRNSIPAEQLRSGMTIVIPALDSTSRPEAAARATLQPPPAASDSTASSGPATSKPPASPPGSARGNRDGSSALVTASSASSETDSDKSGDARRRRSYRVKKGDTLSEIAQAQLGTTKALGKLTAANRDLLGERPLQEGMVLRIP